MPFDEIKKIISQTEGWLTEKEGEFLYDTAKKCMGKGVILEIGSWKGRSTVCLALGSKTGKGVKIYSIDPHIGGIEQKMFLDNKSSFEEFKRNMKKAEVEDIIKSIVKTSKEAVDDWNRPVEFLWIDGDHSYDGAKLDFDFYSPFVVEDGIIAFHDSAQGDVLKVVQEVFRRRGFRNFGLIDSIFYAEKNRERKSVKDYFILTLHKNYNKFHKLPFKKYYKNFFKKVISKI